MDVMQVVVGVIVRDQQVLISRRQKHQHLAGCWEFPGGKVELNEPLLTALSRELKEELDIEVNQSDCEAILQIKHKYPERTVCLEIFLVKDFTGQEQGLEQQEIRWVKLSEIAEYQFPEANLEIIQWLDENLRKC